jgi:ATP-dependent Clp protease ATP-binding subunit ClpA
MISSCLFLDDGTCTDNMGRVLDFSESIFIFTSNAGVSDIKVGKKARLLRKRDGNCDQALRMKLKMLSKETVFS